MRTPEEIFKLLIGFIEDGVEEGPVLCTQPDCIKATSMLFLAAWRDECVEEACDRCSTVEELEHDLEAMRAEAPAGELGIALQAAHKIKQLAHEADNNDIHFEACRIVECLLSRAPRAAIHESASSDKETFDQMAHRLANSPVSPDSCDGCRRLKDASGGACDTCRDDPSRPNYSRLVGTPFIDEAIWSVEYKRVMSMLGKSEEDYLMTLNLLHKAQARADAAEAEREQALDDLVDADNALDSLIPKLKAAEAERDELQSLFDLQRTRMDAATKRWQVAHDSEALPDLGDLLDWLMACDDEEVRISGNLRAALDRLKAALTESLMASAGQANEIVHLREENEALRVELGDAHRQVFGRVFGETPDQHARLNPDCHVCAMVRAKGGGS